MSDEHVTVDGTLEAWASQKSLQRKDGDTDGDDRNVRGHDRKNGTHASTTDPDARLYGKSNNAEARRAYPGHLLMENRHGLIVDARASVADRSAEREPRRRIPPVRSIVVARMSPRAGIDRAPAAPGVVLRDVRCRVDLAPEDSGRGSRPSSATAAADRCESA